MRIGIDARSILNPRKSDAIGSGHYTYQLIRHLLECDTKNEYVLFFDARVRQKDIRKFTRPNTKIVFYPFSDYKKYLPGVYNEILGAAILSRESLDVLHVTSAEMRIPSTYRGKVIVTMHDMGMYRIPTYYKKMWRARMQLVHRMILPKADRIIAVSEAIRSDLVRFGEAVHAKTTVIHSGIDERFFSYKGVNERSVPKKFGITKKYILFLGTIEPSKNVTRLLHAFSLFKESRAKRSRQEKCDYQLLIAGKPGWLSQDIKNFVADLQLTKDVRFTGYVIGDEVVPLFHQAQFFVLPTLYEGFGTTILEAFATGTPAIVGDGGSVSEIAGDAARLVNPIDVKEIASAMIDFADNDDIREVYKQKGVERAKQFDWQKTASATLAIYASVVQEKV